MPIATVDLASAAARSIPQRGVAPRAGQATAFLCHSHRDRNLALGMQQLLREHGMDLYIDWQDASMPERPDAETAGRLRLRIVGCRWFLFLATSNSMTSRWCPWELGYADGKKANDAIAVVPTRDGQTTHGSEYLQLYRRIEPSSDGSLVQFAPNASQGTYVKHL